MLPSGANVVVSTRRVEPWAGLRPMMPTMLPRVGAGKRANVFYNTGHGHLGWTLSAITAHQLVDHVQAHFAKSSISSNFERRDRTVREQKSGSGKFALPVRE